MIGENFVEELTVTALGDYEVSNDNTSYDESTTFTQDEGIILDQTLYVRLKADLGTGPHNGTLTFTSENMTTIVLNLEGTVSETATYNILLDDDIANGSIESNKTIAEEDDEVTLTAHPDQYYELSEWSVVEDDMTTPVSVSNNKFSMPASDVYVTATFSRIQYTITYSVQGNTSTIPSAQFNAGQVATLASATIPGQTFLGWSTSANSTTVVKNYIPTADATLYAVFGDLIDGDLSITVSTPNFPTSYGTANTFTEYTLLGKKFKIQQAYINSGKLQWRAGGDTNGTGTMYNSENFGRITSIVLVYNSSDTKKNFTIKGGTTENPTGGTAITPSNSGSTYTFDFSDYSFNYFVMANGANAGYLDQIIVNYEESHPFTGVTNITTNTTISDPIAASDRIVVTNGAVLTFKGTNNGTAANLVIEEGAQLYSNSPVAATFKKSVSAASTKAVDGWIAISSSVHDTDKSYESVYNVTSLISGSYDMFYYDEETKTWMNQKAGSGATGFTTMVRGQGYIYRNAAAKELAFTGVTNVGTFNEYQLSYNCSDTRVKGFNLVGNPYPHKIYKGVDFATTTDTLTTGYYVLEGNGSWTAKSDAIAIDVNQAILVEATEDAHEKYLQFKDKTKPAAKDAKSNNDNIQFIVENSEYSDVAYAWFDKGNGLKKINHRNASIPMLYINQNGTDYAIATMSDETQSFNLNFKAMTMGKYTLSFNATGNYDYLHVIDRLTGEDVDMLLEGKYSFIATPGDNEKRFIVKLAYIPNNSGNIDDNFAFQNGSDIIVSGNGELQIFDVTGRSVMTTTINGVETINVPTSGIYIFRLIGNEVKTQKIVVR